MSTPSKPSTTTETATPPAARPALSGRRWLVAVGVLFLLAGAGFAWWTALDSGQRRALALETREAIAARDLPRARAAIERWKAIRPSDGEPFAWLARVHLMGDAPQDALKALEEAAGRRQDLATLTLLRAILLARAGRADEALPVLRRAYAAPGVLDAEVADGMVRAYLSTFQFGPAAHVLERWIKEVPDDPRPYLYRNEIDQRSDATADVMITNYRMALQRNPNLDKARLGLADKLRDSQRSDEAEDEYKTYLARNPRSIEGHIGAGQIALRKGELAIAVKHFETALEVDPKEPTALRELALIDLRAGAYDRARKRLETVIEVDPYDPEVHLSYSRALRFSGKAEQAKKEAETVERLRKDHQEMNDIRKAIVERPNDLTLRLRAARWLLDHGHEAEGLDWTQLTLKQHPGHPETCRLLEEYHRRKGNTGLANYYKMAGKPQ